MPHAILLPRPFRIIGLAFIFPLIILGYYVVFKDFEFAFLNLYEYKRKAPFRGDIENFTNELTYLGVILCLFFIGFSKLRIEDEYLQKLRLDACLWAFFIHAGLLILSTFVFYSDDFLIVMIINLIMPFVIYILRFYYLVYKNYA